MHLTSVIFDFPSNCTLMRCLSMPRHTFDSLIEWRAFPTKSVRLLVMQAEAPSSIMRFVASDSKVIRLAHGMMFKLVRLPTQLGLLPCNCVVHMITSFIISLCRLNLLQMILRNAGDRLLFLVTLNPCMKTSICLHIQFPTGIGG